MSNNRKKYVYAPKIEATENNLKDAQKEFDKVMREAPKPMAFHDKHVVVKPSFTFTGKKINLSDLLDDFGHFGNDNQKDSDQKHVEEPAEKIENRLK